MSSEMLKKKRVPDWLNSSLWSSNPAPQEDQRLLRHTPKPETLAPLEPSPPPSPPPQTLPKQEERPTTEPDEDHPTVHDPKLPAFSAEEISRQAQLLAELSSKVVSLTEVRRLASQGIPDGAGIRSTVWKILLGYLPADRGLWATELAKKRAQYALFKEELLVNPSEIARRLDKSIDNGNEAANCEGSGMLPRSEITHGEHPLSLGKTSVWNQFFQDSEIIEQIDRDVMRTHPDLHFFSGDSFFAKSNQEALRHILIVFAKLNPGIRYVQGMNEVLAPLFYVFRNDPDEENAASAEADTFFCFVEVLSGFRDHFCQQLDNSVVGIRSTITRLSQLLKEHDEELWRHLEVTTKVNPQFYAFRWITLLLTQEFNFADSLHIWDTLLSDPEGPQETLLRICCAMLILIRRRLLAGDFTSNLKLLQNYPSANISHLLYVADKLRARPAA
ncbi:Rab-GTPase-TBC domain-containing protein [Cinnamomum micranthum f. kanehirae]|uniref:Rab-GTPase-TBC domain-containing protein n=1 Tax=Cinnamomum micranthum f. kanehirae TaxID=337451 RepID=A0A3S3LZZ0_9MAGN|nr:Rab-GTPase-TBC domain-containing protein [Cinnamomum micranthum f. kanehirae]